MTRSQYRCAGDSRGIGRSRWQAETGSGSSQPRLPGPLRRSRGEGIAQPDERQSQQPIVGEQPLDDLVVAQAHVAQAQLLVPVAFGVQQCRGAEPLHEAAQLPRRDRLAFEVDESDAGAPLLEEPQRGLRRARVRQAEHLDGRAKRCGHSRKVSGPRVARRATGRGAPWPLPEAARGGYHPRRRCCVIWFTLQLDDKPGALARMAAALGERGVKIKATRRIAGDNQGAMMLATSDAAGTRAAFESVKLAFEEHDPEAGLSLGEMPKLAQGLADRGMNLGS